MPKNEERRSHIVSSSSSSPRFFSWKCRNNSTKRNHHRQQQQQQQQEQQRPPISMSSPSSPLMIEKEQQISSCSSPQLVRLSTPKPINIDEQRSLITPKNHQIRKIDENSNQSDMDEHIQIALYAQQLASISEKQKQNPTGIQPPIRFPSVPMNLQMNNQYHPRMMTTTPTPSTMVPMSSIRSMHMDHQSAGKRLIISKLEAKNR
jgi:hypothetical protein